MILASDIQIITSVVTEEINKKYLDEFITTQLEINNIILDNNTYIWNNYYSNTNHYEIYILNTNEIDFDIEVNIFSSFYKNTPSALLDLFVTKDFFVLYQNKKVFAFKTIQNSSIEDITNYIDKTYNLILDNTYAIDEKQFEDLANKYKNQEKTNHNFKKIKVKKFIKYLILSSVVSLMIFIYSLYNMYIETHNYQDTITHKLQMQYRKSQLNNQKYKKISTSLMAIFKYLEVENIQIEETNYAKNKLILTLSHTNKQNILNFITVYQKTITINSSIYLEDEKINKMVVQIEI